jgi:hypothetical protein
MTPLFFTPQRAAGSLLFAVFALLPAIVHLTRLSVSITHPALAAGPLVAGLAVAGRLTATRVGLTSLGTFLGLLIWTANLLMMAGTNECCGTIN